MARNYYLIGTTQPTGDKGLTYYADEPLLIGQLVEIKLRNRRLPGVVLVQQPAPDFPTKPIERVLELPPLPQPILGLSDWLADYYVADPAQAWQTILPAGLLKTRRAINARPASSKTVKAVILTPDQQAAVKAIAGSDKQTTLLQGVTGSGKTEVYQALAEQQLQLGKSSIILVPEIALTPQTEARFRTAFGDRVLLTHSGLTEATRFAVWRQALETTEPRVVIGPRSALFLPLAKLGLIVIDECQETSYKQEQAPRFETAVAAAQLARLHHAKLVLGSATPGLREAYLATRGRIGKILLKQRFNEIVPAPPIIVDLKNPQEFANHQIFSRTLSQHLVETLAAGRQSLLFLNRRGSASSQLCTNCGYVSLCPRCKLPLTFHADKARLVCHSCNFHQAPPAVCPACSQPALRFLGIGTKRVETELQQLLPTARVARMDRDSLAGGGLDKLYADLRDHKLDVLIGTQMVAKGLDLPGMETIGVILADSSLYLPDFAATERTYSLLTQVSGRAGRRQHPGRTIIQTYSTQHPAIQALANDDYWQFAHQELAERQALGYPPFKFLLKLTYTHGSDDQAAAAAGQLAKAIQRPDVTVLGPAPAWRQFAVGRSHWQLIVKSDRRSALQTIAGQVPSGWTVDLDPINVL